MTAPLVDGLAEESAIGFQFDERDVSQSANPRKRLGQLTNRRLALATPNVVLSTAEFVLHHRVADHQVKCGGKFHQAKIQGATVKKQRASLTTITRNKLIHYSATRSDELVFGLLANKCELLRLDRALRHVHQSQSRGHFHCRGRTESRAQRNFALNIYACSSQTVACLFQDPSNAEGIIGPFPCGPNLQFVEIRFYSLIKVFRIES